MMNDSNALKGIPRLTQSKIDKINEILSEYQMTSHIVLELSKLGFSTKNAITILKKYNSNSVKIID